VELNDYRITAESYQVAVQPHRKTKYRIQFIGEMGKILLETHDPQGTYTFSDHEGYFRPKVLDSNGKIAWLQPTFLDTGR